MEFRKGNTVKASASVELGSYLAFEHRTDVQIVRFPENCSDVELPRTRVLARCNGDFQGIVVGWALLTIDVCSVVGPTSWNYDWSTNLYDEEFVHVVMVQPTGLEVWIPSRACLAEDLTLVEGE